MPADLIVCSTLRDLPDLRFPHRMMETAHRDHPAFSQRIQSLLGYVYSRGRENWDGVKYELYRHLRRTNHLFKLVVEPEDLAAYGGWAHSANAISIDRAGGGICDPAGRVLLGHGGEQGPEAEMPYPPEARARKARCEALLRAREIPLFEGVPPSVGESEVEPRDAADVARRALALYVVSHVASLVDAGMWFDPADIGRKWPVACGGFTPKEAAFMATTGSDAQRARDIAAAVEGARALFWALAAVDLPQVTENAGSGALDRMMATLAERDFVAAARLRPIGEIFDELDLQFRSQWSITRRMERLPEALPPFHVASAVQERHRALRWLARGEGDESWDEILA